MLVAVAKLDLGSVLQVGAAGCFKRRIYKDDRKAVAVRNG